MALRLKPISSGPIPKAPAKRAIERRLRDKAYLEYLHRLPCCVSGNTIGVIAHHITVGRGRIGVKEGDELAVPLHHSLHDQHAGALHVIGEPNFWNKYGIDPLGLCADLYGHYEQCGAIVDAGIQIIAAHREIARTRLRVGLLIFATKNIKV